MKDASDIDIEELKKWCSQVGKIKTWERTFSQEIVE